MNAKDTVIATENTLHRFLVWDEGGGYTSESVADILLRQAEVSFKAGIREVIEWINGPCLEHKEGLGLASRMECPKCWKAKLKEWSIV